MKWKTLHVSVDGEKQRWFAIVERVGKASEGRTIRRELVSDTGSFWHLADRPGEFTAECTPELHDVVAFICREKRVSWDAPADLDEQAPTAESTRAPSAASVEDRREHAITMFWGFGLGVAVANACTRLTWGVPEDFTGLDGYGLGGVALVTLAGCVGRIVRAPRRRSPPKGF